MKYEASMRPAEMYQRAVFPISEVRTVLLEFLSKAAPEAKCGAGPDWNVTWDPARDCVVMARTVIVKEEQPMEQPTYTYDQILRGENTRCKKQD